MSNGRKIQLRENFLLNYFHTFCCARIKHLDDDAECELDSLDRNNSNGIEMRKNFMENVIILASAYKIPMTNASATFYGISRGLRWEGKYYT